MRPQRVLESDLLEGLMGVLRARGYDGASLNELASSSGLKKASLYHRYPGGKKEVALAVLNYVDSWVEAHIFDVLADQSLDATERIQTVIANINNIYDAGNKACILRALSTESGLALFGEELRQSMNGWIESFGQFGRELGQSEAVAERNAYKVLSLIQGSLVIAKSMADSMAFIYALAEIEQLYAQ